MKRIIARFGPNGECLEKESPNTAAYNAYIGRQLSVGCQTVMVEEIIAEGGYGVVFKVRNFSHKYFALKRVCVNNEEDLARSKQEMALLRQFQHKNIVRLTDTGISRNQSGVYEVYMLLQYCKGTVRELVDRAIAQRMDIPERTIVKMFCDMCEAVGVLHQRNVIHRDLKIENILIDDSGDYVLCDFGSATTESLIPRSHGIAKTEEEIAKYTSIAYRAPEMVDLYKNMEIGTKADIWALGCLLYTLCFLKLPFKDSLLAIQAGEYSIPDDSIYSENLRKLIGYMLQTDPVQRPDIYQVSVLTFQLQGLCRSPVNNANSSSAPKFENLSLPKTESELKAKAASAVTSSPAPSQSEPVKTSVVPRQRPRVSSSVGASPLTSCPSSNGTSPPTPGSLPPPPGETNRARQAFLEPSTSHTSTETSSSSVQTSPLLIDVGGGESVASPLCAARTSDKPYDVIISNNRQNLNNVIPTSNYQSLSVHSTSNFQPNNVHSTSNFQPPNSVHSTSYVQPPNNVHSTSNFQPPNSVHSTSYVQPPSNVHSTSYVQPPSNVHSTLYVQPPNSVPSTSYVQPPSNVHSTAYVQPPNNVLSTSNFQTACNGLSKQNSCDSADLLSFDSPTSAPAFPVAPFSFPGPPRTRLALPSRPPGHRRLLSDTSAVAGLGAAPLRPLKAPLGPTFAQASPLKASCSMDFIGGDPHSGKTAAIPPSPYANPHHQWQQPLRGNRQLSSSSADLINLSSNAYTSMVHPNRQFGASQSLAPPTSAIHQDALRATSALELDAFGSVPFASTPIPPRPHPIQGHTRSASHGQCFRRP